MREIAFDSRSAPNRSPPPSPPPLRPPPPWWLDADLDTTIVTHDRRRHRDTPARQASFRRQPAFHGTATMNDGSRESRASARGPRAAGGTIRPDGLFTAVGDSGSLDVVATAVGGVAGTATVRVAPAAILALPPAVPPGPPWWQRLWVLWVALGASILAVVARLLWPPPLPPITYALRTKPPSFSIDEDASGRGLALSLSLTNDAGVQGIRETPFNAP